MRQPGFDWKQGECPLSPPLRSTVQPGDVKGLPEADKPVLLRHYDQKDKVTGTLLFWDVAEVRKILGRKATNG